MTVFVSRNESSDRLLGNVRGILRSCHLACHKSRFVCLIGRKFAQVSPAQNVDSGSNVAIVEEAAHGFLQP